MATEPIRDKKQLQAIAQYFLKNDQLRNYVLIILGVYTALRISDLLSLRWSDVYDFKRGCFLARVEVTERKTGKRRIIALNRQAIAALKQYFPQRVGDFIFENNRKDHAAISRVQAWRIIKKAAAAVEAAAKATKTTKSAKLKWDCRHISCHSLRKTFGYHAGKNGASPIMLMDIFNHSNYATTRKYLGITQDDRDGVYLLMTLFA